MSRTSILQDFKAACDACDIRGKAAMLLFKNYLASSVEAVMNAPVELPTKTAKSKEGCLASFLAIVNNLLKHFATDDDNASVDANIRNFKQGSLTATKFSQQQWTKPLRRHSV